MDEQFIFSVESTHGFKMLVLKHCLPYVLNNTKLRMGLPKYRYFSILNRFSDVGQGGGQVMEKVGEWGVKYNLSRKPCTSGILLNFKRLFLICYITNKLGRRKNPNYYMQPKTIELIIFFDSTYHIFKNFSRTCFCLASLWRRYWSLRWDGGKSLK